MSAKPCHTRLHEGMALADEAWHLLSPATQAAIVERFPPDGPAEEFLADLLDWWRANRPACYARLRGMQRNAVAAEVEVWVRRRAGIGAGDREDAA